ncbi:YhcB family protein [Algibacillus agarilyticus]|uniref:YhcB family protein n=1 Tax=Algibacillus agarilyticus TaxID=2234133 RepID=UPI000DD05BF1|nr:DUF1043 family protein [Algibacillus agarilyticus]
MTWLIGTSIFIAGTIIGFVVNHFLSLTNQKKKQLEAELAEKQQTQDELKVALNEYLAGVESAFLSLAEQAQQAAVKANEFSSTVSSTKKPIDEIIPYFGSAVTEGLKQTKPVEQLSKNVEKASTDNAPLDYTEGNSGILMNQTAK